MIIGPSYKVILSYQIYSLACVSKLIVRLSCLVQQWGQINGVI